MKVIAEEYGVCSEYVAIGLVEDIFKAMIATQNSRESGDSHAEITRGDSEGV